MVRAAAFLVLLSSLTLMAQRTGLDRALLQQTICGPVAAEARMLDPSLDETVAPHQAVRITLNNLKSMPIVLERVTLHFGGETPTSGAPVEWETSVPVDAGQEAVFTELTTVPNPVSYLEVNYVRYADGSSWQPTNGQVCKIVPERLRN